jgi:hypothetical protein
MRIFKNVIWTWHLPDNERPINRALWFDHGGKWLIFDLYSYSSKFMTILKSYGIIGAYHLFKDAMKTD